MTTLEIVIRGMAAGANLALSAAMLRGPRRTPVHWAGGVFTLSVAAYALNSRGAETAALGVMAGPVWVLATGGTAWFWLFCMTLFRDRRFSWWWTAPVALTTLVAVLAYNLYPFVGGVGWVVHNLLEVALMVHVTAMIVRSWGGDMVETRRGLRGPFITIVMIYCVLQSGFELLGIFGWHAGWSGLVEAATVAILSIVGAAAFLSARPDLFDPPQTARAAPAADVPVQDRPTLAKLKGLMETDEVWRREGLTIGLLAGELKIPEHRLRKLINQHLGYRNFTDFLNASRLAAAKAALADPAQARASISALAYDLGYGSLGPFNRAFKEATGTTPSAWRIKALEDAGPAG